MALVPARRLSGTLLRVVVIEKRPIDAKAHTSVSSQSVGQGSHDAEIIFCRKMTFIRIKRRSAFVAHLRKHGLDPKSIDLDAIVSQSNEGGSPAPAHFAASDVESKSHDIIGSRSASPSSLCDSR